MSKKNAIVLEESAILEAISIGKTMRRAAQLLLVDSRTFKKNAERFGLYDGSGKGGGKFLLEDILAGKHPQYPTSKLSKRLVSSGLKEYKCEQCGIADWNNSAISLELNHIDGDNSNHSLDNLELLCPNCHSQTSTYRSKNVKNRNILKINRVVEGSNPTLPAITFGVYNE